MLEISPDIYAWLISIDVLDDSTYNKELEQTNKQLYPQYPSLPASVANFNFTENGTVSLSKPVLKSILTGFFFPGLFSKINLLMNTIYGNIYKNDESLLNVINDEMPQIKLRNWELLLESIKNYYGLIFDDKFKTLLVAGDNSTFNDLFTRLFTFYTELQQKIDKENETNFLKKNNTKKLEMPVFDNDKTKELPKVRFNEDVVDLDELTGEGNELKPLNQTRSVLEFIIVALCKAMSLTAKQSAALLSDNKKYLTHILIKGLSKKNFGPVKQFYQEVLGNVDYFIQLIQINSIAFPNQISKNIELSLSTFKPGILSKNIDIVYIAGRLMSKLALELIEINLISAAWDWFVMPNGGLEACILCLKKHDTAVEVVVTLMNNFGRFHIYELFTIYLKNFLQSDGAYLDFVSDIFAKFAQMTNFNDEFSKNNLKQFFFEIAIEVSRSTNINERMKTALFLSELWINFSMYIDSNMENYQLLAIFKSLYKDNNYLVQIVSITQLFRVFLSFISERNSFVSIIFKSLIFNFIEYHSYLPLRELMIANFQYTFKVVLSIPIGILVEPYVKQILLTLGKSYFFNISDLTFLTTIARHARFNVKEAVLALDVLGKIYYDVGEEVIGEKESMRTNTYRGIYFYKPVSSVFTMILSRYLMHEIGVEFCFKYVKMLIQTFCRLDKPLSDKIYNNAIVLNLNPETHKEKLVFEEDIILNESEKNKTVNYRSLSKMTIVLMVQSILSINNTFINSVIKNLIIVAAMRHYEVYSFFNIGLSKMISHFGNCHDLIYYYNVNKEELDIDREFEIVIKLIYDTLQQKNPPQAVPEEEKNNTVVIGALQTEATNQNQNRPKLKTLVNKESRRMSRSEKKLYKRSETVQLQRLTSLKTNSIIDRLNKMRSSTSIYEHDKLIDYNKKAKAKLEEPRLVPLNNNIELINLNNEEDRDIIKLKIFLKDYNAFFKEVFMKYSGSIYHPIKGKVFNAIKEIADTISPSEVVKMFKEHGRLKYELTKDEILMILGIMNNKVFQKPSLSSGISFDEFIEDFIQLSYYSFCKPPYVYRHYSISDYSEEMIKLFSREFPENIKYLHPDKLLSKKEAHTCKEINKKLEYSMFTPIPNGYKKYLDTQLVYKYYVPDNLYWVIGESKKICIELVDEIIYKAIGLHTLEGFASVKENYKIRPIMYNKEKKKNTRTQFEEEKLRVLKERNNKTPLILKKAKVEKEAEYDTGQKNKNIRDILIFTGKNKK